MHRSGGCLFLVLHLALLGSCHGQEQGGSLDGSLKGVSVGYSGVWGVDGNGNVYCREQSYDNQGSSGVSWTILDGQLKQLDVGRDIVWGVNENNDIFARLGISEKNPTGTEWIQVKGSLMHISVSDNGHVWGVSQNKKIYYRQGASQVALMGTLIGDTWRPVEGRMKQISAGQSGVWGVNDSDDVYYRVGTYNDNGKEGTDWEKVSGKLKYVSSGQGVVVGVNREGDIYRREGVSAEFPSGKTWSKLKSLGLASVDGFDYNSFWAVSDTGSVYRISL